MEATSAIAPPVLRARRRPEHHLGQPCPRQGTTWAQIRRLDAVWLCKVAERQMLRPSFIPPGPIRRLRLLTRYRIGLVSDQTREKNRVEKLLENPRSSCRSWPVTSSESPAGR